MVVSETALQDMSQVDILLKDAEDTLLRYSKIVTKHVIESLEPVLPQLDLADCANPLMVYLEYSAVSRNEAERLQGRDSTCSSMQPLLHSHPAER